MQQGIRPSRYDTPYEFSPLAERTILEPYGKIETLKRTVFRDYPNIFDGKVIVSFTELYTDRLPDVFQLKGGQIIVRVKMVPHGDKQHQQETRESPHVTSTVQSVVQELEKAQIEKGKIPIPVQNPLEKRERSKERHKDKRKDGKGNDKRSESRQGREHKR